MESRRLLISFVTTIAILFTTLLVVTNPNQNHLINAPGTEQYNEQLNQPVKQRDFIQGRSDNAETLPTIQESVDWLVPAGEVDERLLELEEAVVSYYTLLINSFACGEVIEDYDVLDLSEVQMQNVLRYLENKMLFLEKIRAHDIDLFYHWHKPLVTIEEHLMSSDEAELIISLELSNMTPDDNVPELVKCGLNSFRLRKIDGGWKIYDIDLLDDSENMQYLNREALIDLWTPESVESMLAALRLN